MPNPEFDFERVLTMPQKGNNSMKALLFTLLLIQVSISLAACAPETVPQARETPPPAAVAPEPAVEAPPKAKFDASGFAMKLDPVCKMSLEEYEATDTIEYDGGKYGFCSNFCAKKFQEDPAAILKRFEAEPAT